jgi:hypothetical protein
VQPECRIEIIIPFLGSGEFHDQGDTKWIEIRGSLWGHNDMTCGQPAPGQPIGCPRSGHPQGIIGVFSNYYLVILIFNIVPVISELT